MAKDPALLGLVRPYGGVFGDDPNKASFDQSAAAPPAASGG
jgi:hypothetical protein